MKKCLVLAVLTLAILVTPALAQEQPSVAELQAIIAQLMAQIAALQSGGQSSSNSNGFCYTFNQNLRVGDSGNDVFQLYRALYFNRTGVLPNDYTNQFDERLASDLVSFQEKYTADILTPNGLTRGTGYAGPSTRAKLNQLYGCGANIRPVITGDPIFPPTVPSIPRANVSGTTNISVTTKSSIKVISPNGGETWQLGQLATVRWSPTNLANAVVYLVTTNGRKCALSSGRVATGSYTRLMNAEGVWCGDLNTTLGAGQYRILVADANGLLEDGYSSGYINLVPGPTISSGGDLGPANLASATAGSNYGERIIVFDVVISDADPIQWSVTGGFLPPGLNLQKPDGQHDSEWAYLTGIPTMPGSYTFTVKASNNKGSASRSYTLVVGANSSSQAATLNLYANGSNGGTPVTHPGNGRPVTLTWTSSGVTTNTGSPCSKSGDWNGYAPADSGSTGATNVFPPNTGATYTLTCPTVSGSSISSSVRVLPLVATVAGSFSADPTTIDSGGQVTFNWTRPTTSVSPKIYFSCQSNAQAIDPLSNQNYCGQWLNVDTIASSKQMVLRNSGSTANNVNVTFNYLESAGGPGNSRGLTVVVKPVITNVLPSLSTSNALVTTGQSVVNSTGTVVSYNYQMSLTVNNSSNADAFLSNRGGGDDIITVLSPTTASASYALVAAPNSLPGDVPGVSLVVPAGSSRTLTYSVQLLGQGTNGLVSYRITGLRYGTTASNPTGLTLSSGLNSLAVSAMFAN